MDAAQVLEYCLRMPGVYLDYPHGEHIACVRLLKGRGVVAQVFELKGRPAVTLKCKADFGALFREMYPGTVVRGWHCPPVQQPYFSTVYLDAGLPDAELVIMMDHAWHAVAARLPKARRAALPEWRSPAAD